MLTGLLMVCAALVFGAVIAAVNAVRRPGARMLVAAVVPAAVCYVAARRGRLVRQQLHRQAERAGSRNALHRQQHCPDAAGVRPGSLHAARVPRRDHRRRSRSRQQPATLQNIRLWDWHALQDTLRQVQEIRTYYDFPDIDIDRYTIDGAMREVMIGTRELNVDKLPDSSRNWINEKLVYTHGYGITMNPVNGFTSGRPAHAAAEQHARAEHRARPERHPPRDLFRRTDQHRRLRQDPAAGVRLSAGRDQQPDVVPGHRRHHAGRTSPPHRHRLRPRRPGQAAVQRRCELAKPAADAAQRARARRRPGALPHLRPGPLHRGRRRWPAVLDDRRLHHLRQLSLLDPLRTSTTTPSTTCGTASRW